MKIVRTKNELKSLLSGLDTSSGVGLVPTMGALHEGHMSLVKKAFDENAITVVSVFVNPTQFDNNDDLEKYPRTLDADIELLKQISDEIIIFAPSVSNIYPDGQYSETYDFKGLDQVMEGAFREGHYNGVATIVEKFLNLVEPTKAYFGEKDFQQLLIIKNLVALKKIPVEIIGCPIVREENGLARSSRNERLSKKMRDEASFIHSTLSEAKNKFEKMSANKVLAWGKKQFEKHPDLDLEYLNIAEASTLKLTKRKKPKTKYMLFIAVYAEGIRLIDNIVLN
ncbi:pantoate--beta-alanine ligase [Aurantibacter crassamenti]|uniref:pantoate--beta-alanine ligase n=1 Tax=Aurantibacter crassamenti TaxID=1837375 RepID=UPI0019399A3D|nr:pantoate--beta-alanine ligase [Aurantibacter crassamenti]MBM1104873.1 pantoate--beta-alanine ligase [Aurantibacter crassamenti]